MQENTIEIASLDMEARGVGHLQNEDGTPGKVVFVEGALPGELVSFQPQKRKAKWETATLTEIHRESAQRVRPACPSFGICGGCVMQHFEPSAQVAVKQRVLEDNLKHIGKVKPETMLRPIYGPTWGYRYRARISVRHVVKKGSVLVGFHERKSHFITDMKSCEVLPRHVSDMLVPLRELIASLTIIDKMPQIELAVGEGEHGLITAMVLRIMAPLTPEDEQKLKVFADRYQVQWWLQPAGPDSAYQYYPTDTRLQYLLPEFGIRMPFKPTDRVADLFCGLGNFTLPLATRAREVVGIEGSSTLTDRALDNARENGVSEKTTFYCRNLFELSVDDWVALGKFDRLLIDPPREGAFAVVQAIAALGEERKAYRPHRIVYVSCAPATLARDADVLVHQAGYVMKHAGVVNMFPHTSHVESIAVFEMV